MRQTNDSEIGYAKHQMQVEKLFESVEIENFKSITKLKLDLGLVNVFIGENGAGKSNVLEALALAGAAEAQKLDNEFLAARGIRVTSPQFMRSAFDKRNLDEPIKISLKTTDGYSSQFTISNDNKPYSSWTNVVHHEPVFQDLLADLRDYAYSISDLDERIKTLDRLLEEISNASELPADAAGGKPKYAVNFSITKNWRIYKPIKELTDFIVYSPENSSLRLFEREGQIEPLGINGEGLLKLLTVMSQDEDMTAINSVKKSLQMLSWFEDFNIPEDNVSGQLQIKDGFVDPGCAPFDQRSANEGFLFVTFYFALFASNLTPSFLAVDNIDASLNPKLCAAMMERLINMAKTNKKQCIFTTHNPAILDGLDIDDPDQRLFIVSRNTRGHTKVRRFEKKAKGEMPKKLSELFLGGFLGGLPMGF